MNSLLLGKRESAARRTWVDVGWALAFTMVIGGCALAADQADLKITVRVQNYAKVSSRVLGGAEKEASRVFTIAGIKAEWLDCPVSQAQGPPGPTPANDLITRCARPLDGADILLRVLPGYAPPNPSFRDMVFGFAETRDAASVFYEPIENLAWGWDGDQHDTPVLLGDVIAHEIGHLLLGSNSHSPTGIMSAKWDRQYLRLALMGVQLFSPEQSSLMRETVLRRKATVIQP